MSAPITILIPSLQFQHLTYHNASQSEVMFWTARTALQTRLTNSLRLEADAGVAYVNATSKGLGIIDTTVPVSGSLVGSGLLPIQSVPPSGSAIDWVGSIRFDLHTENCRIGIIGGADDWTDDLWSISKN